jgi:hypothetical protein
MNLARNRDMAILREQTEGGATCEVFVADITLGGAKG